MKNFKQKKIVIVGLGKTGIATALFLHQQGANVTTVDINDTIDNQKLTPLIEKDIAIELGPYKESTFLESDLIILSPGVPETIAPLVKVNQKQIPVMGEIELASLFIKEPIIAISGTNGKTTTVTLIDQMLRESGKKVFMGGNIGTPLIQYVSNQDPADIVLIEVSSFQLDTIQTFRPHIGVLLNITEDHLDRYSSFDAYCQSKARLFMNQTNTDYAILNGNDPYIRKHCNVLNSKPYYFSAREHQEYGITIYDNRLTIESNHAQDDQGNVFDLSHMKLIGNHNIENISAAVLASWAAGATHESIQQTIYTFKGLPHRVEFVDSIEGVQFYDDSKATNVDAVVRALNCFKSPVHLILGGRDKGGDYGILRQPIRNHVKQLLIYGEARERIRSAFSDMEHLTIIDCGQNHLSLEHAVHNAFESADPGNVVLLSPACSSFDLFDSYVHRGNVFKSCVAKLIL